MQIGVIGINHKSADIILRESLAKVCQKRFSFCEEALVLLSTCNRTEIYFSSEDLPEMHSFLLNEMRKDLPFAFEHHIYSYFGGDCFVHLANVTSGMDSAIIGETEIQRQVKEAYEKAQIKNLPRELHYLFQKALKIGKEIRSKNFEGILPTLEETIFQTCERSFNLHEKKILIVGLSAINRKILKNFQQHKLPQITICNRTHEKVSQVISEDNLSYISWSSLSSWTEFDVIIVGTSSPNYVITNPIKITSSKMIIDLSVPRNVDPEMAKHPHITLFNLDQLITSIDQKRKGKAEKLARQESKQITSLVDKQIELFTMRESFRLALQVS